MDKVNLVLYRYVKPTLENPVIRLLIIWLTVISIVFSITDLPMFIQQIFHSIFFKVIITFLGFYTVTGDLVSSVLASGIILCVFYLAIYFKEGFKMVFPTPDIYPGCVGIKMADILAIYNGDVAKLKSDLHAIGMPYSVQLTDDNAPYIGTYLVGFGKMMSQTCKPPGA